MAGDERTPVSPPVLSQKSIRMRCQTGTTPVAYVARSLLIAGPIGNRLLLSRCRDSARGTWASRALAVVSFLFSRDSRISSALRRLQGRNNTCPRTTPAPSQTSWHSPSLVDVHQLKPPRLPHRPSTSQQPQPLPCPKEGRNQCRQLRPRRPRQRCPRQRCPPRPPASLHQLPSDRAKVPLNGNAACTASISP